MKFILSLSIMMFSASSFSNVDTQITCLVDDYVVKMSAGVLDNNNSYNSEVTVYKDEKLIYKNQYELNYIVDPNSRFGLNEVWAYTDNPDGGVIAVAAISDTEGKSDLFIDLNETDYIDGSSIDCSLERNN